MSLDSDTHVDYVLPIPKYIPLFLSPTSAACLLSGIPEFTVSER